MSYLSHDARRQMILETAVNIAFTEGLAAMTVRRVAQEAQIAVGQIHRHFASASDLKAEAFLLSVTQSLALLKDSGKTEGAGCLEMMSWSLVTSQFEELRHYSQLWKEAEVISWTDEAMLKGFRAATKEWHNVLVELLETGIANGEFTCKRPVDAVAWDCIAFSCGLDGIFSLKMEEFGDNEYQAHAEYFLKSQLDVNK
ncbi:TetR family transcriptional regulator [Enterobacter sp. Bisph1]|uniref:TetR family transcriptional regulator n=1 Tax=Enterobacter sp. Bisph1 TaxID=1274399 RepID=UPI00057C314C|nr:TetR family transcriptional regulator [Enterobacter sp. Bisph1]